MSRFRPTAPALVRACLVGAGTAALLLAGATTAAAHVTITPSTTAAGSYAVLTTSVGHGCDGSPTTTIAIQMPDEIVTVTPTINQGWTVEKQMETLDEPIDNGHGGEYTERVDQVVYTAKTPLPEGFRDTFELSLQLPGEEGTQLVFPVLQSCEEGETAWSQTYEEGSEEPEHPAPFFEVTAATGEDHHGSTDDAETEEHAEAETSAESDGSDVLGWIALALGGLGLAAGGTALARSRK